MTQKVLNGDTPELPWIAKARALIGTTEIKGSKHNPTIIGMAKDIGINWIVTDETPWCAVFVGHILKQSGLAYQATALARNYSKSVKALDKTKPCYGAVAVFWRGTPKGQDGHIGFVVGLDKNIKGNWLILGGNQGDSVSIISLSPARLLHQFWPSIAPSEHRYNLPITTASSSSQKVD